MKVRRRSKKKIVVKLGSNVLTNADDGLDIQVIEDIADQVAILKAIGVKIVIVSSGAVAAGKAVYTLQNVKSKVRQRQVYSSIGQAQLMNTYAAAFAKHNLICAQVLATKEDFIGLENYKNMRNCFSGLLKDDIIPIVNENDVVSLTELMFTDNDELAGLTAHMINANKLVILSTIDGVYKGDPNDPNVDIVRDVLPGENIMRLASKAKSSGGRGGMKTKIDIAMRAQEKGIETVIANGKSPRILLDIFDQKSVGTRFKATHIKKEL